MPEPRERSRRSGHGTPRTATPRLFPGPHRLLIATPALADPEFFRTVVFLIEHDDTGTVGVIINRPSHTPVGQILIDWQDVMSEPAVVFNGGPVQRDGALGLGRLAGATDAGHGLRAVSGGLALVDLDANPRRGRGGCRQLAGVCRARRLGRRATRGRDLGGFLVHRHRRPRRRVLRATWNVMAERAAPPTRSPFAAVDVPGRRRSQLSSLAAAEHGTSYRRRIPVTQPDVVAEPDTERA